jgi:hypothetical protein
MAAALIGARAPTPKGLRAIPSPRPAASDPDRIAPLAPNPRPIPDCANDLGTPIDGARPAPA